MKKSIYFLLIFILSLNLFGCNNSKSADLPKPKTSGDATVLGTDFQKAMNQSTSTRVSEICETEDGYYFECMCMVYFMDKETGESTILCGKPDCAHEESDSCNAYVNSKFLNYYDGKLYYTNSNCVLENGKYVDKGERLFSMNLDGTEHNVVQDLEFTPGGNSSCLVTAPIIHRGIVYFAYSSALYAAELGADIEDAVLIYGEPKENDGSMIIDPNELYYELWAEGDNVYFMAKNVKQKDGTYKDTLFCYDTQTKEVEEVWKVPDKSDVGSWDTTGVSVNQWYVSDGYIYFYLSGNDVWYTELSTGKTGKLVDLDLSAGVASFSDEYMVVMNKEVYGYDLISGSEALTAGDTLYVYGYDGKLVKEISLDKIYKDCDTVSECSILWIEDGKVYVHADATIVGVTNGSISTATTQIHYIYSADISSGTLEKTDWSIGD